VTAKTRSRYKIEFEKPEGERPVPKRLRGPSLSMANHVLDFIFKTLETLDLARELMSFIFQYDLWELHWVSGYVGG